LFCFDFQFISLIEIDSLIFTDNQFDLRRIDNI
jgi:hypothetical protein